MNGKKVNPAKPIADTLESVAAGKRRAQLFRAWLLAASCASAGLLMTVVIDWFAAWQSPAVRWLGPLAVGTLSAILAFRALKISLAAPDQFAAARALDRSVKNSMQHWTTFAALQPGGAGATGSDPMAGALVREMAPMCRHLDPAAIEPAPPPKRSLAVIAGVVILLPGFLAVFHQQGSPRLLARFFLPWSELPLTRLQESSAPPKVLLSGSDLEVISMVSGKRPASIRLEIADGPIIGGDSSLPTRELVAEVPSQTGEPIAFNVGQLRQTLRYRLRAGDALTPWREVKVTERPRLSGIRVTLKDPGYSDRPPRVWHRAPSRARAIRGSEVTVEFEIDRTVNSARLEVPASGDDAAGPESVIQRVAMEEIGDRRFQFRTGLDDDFVFRPAFESTEGFSNAEIPFSHIEVADDQPPAVKLSTESAREIVSLNHDLSVAFEARDDVGVAAAEVVLTITDDEGQTREVVVPLELGDQKGDAEVSLQAGVPLAGLGLKPDDKIAYAVRVRDSFQQAASSGEDGLSSGGKALTKTGDASEASSGGETSAMTRRPLKIGEAGAKSESVQLRIASREMLNRIEPKKKKLLAIEAAFASLKTHTANALRHTRAAQAPENIPGQKRQIAPLYLAITEARNSIDSASKAVAAIAAEAPGTPYAFLSLQLETILQSRLTPADAKLDEAVRSRLRELPPREVYRRQAEGLLTQAMATINSLEKKVSKVRSRVEAEFAMTELMDMYVVQVEDLPVLLSAGGPGTPYQRSPGEVSRAQAEAALKGLEAKKELYRKTAELLRQNPELWQRYMDKSQGESKIYRDELEGLARRHGKVQILTGRTGGDELAAAGVRALIAAHQEDIAAALLRSLEKARTWLPQDGAEPGTEPQWLEPLNAAALSALGNSASESVPVAELKTAAATITGRLDTTVKQLRKSALNAGDHGSARRSFALRLGELRQARAEQGLVNELIASLENRSWRKASLLEQANIAHQTQQLAGKIEMEGARLNTLGQEVKTLGLALSGLIDERLLPALARSVFHLREPATVEAAIPSAQKAQAEAAESYGDCVLALDRYVMAAIRELDRAPAKAGIGGGPKIAAKTLEDLEQKLQEEKEISESFGIPCCRPTNFQVMSDWQRFAGGQTGTPQPGPASPSKKREPDPSGQPGKTPAPSNSGGQGGAGQKPAGSVPSAGKRSEVDVASLIGSGKSGEDANSDAAALSELARAESLRQAKDLANLLSGKGAASKQSGPGSEKASATASPGAAGAGAGSDESAVPLLEDDKVGIRDTPGSTRDWNRLSSQLRREILQERSEDVPDRYRDAIEDYFRALSKWKATVIPAAE